MGEKKSGFFVADAGLKTDDKKAKGEELKQVVQAKPESAKGKSPGKTVDLDTLPKYLGEGGGSNW